MRCMKYKVMQTNREARCGTGALWKMHAVEDESRIKRRSWRQGTIKVQKGTKEKQGKRSRPFFFQSHFFLSLCHFTHQYFESVCVCVCVCARARVCVSMLVLQLFLCVSVGLFKVIHVSGFRGNIHCTPNSALFSSASQFTAGFGWKSSLRSP